MHPATTIFNVEQLEEILLVRPTVDLGELAIAVAEEEAERVLRLVGPGSSKHVVVDLHETSFFGSSAMGFFLRLRKKAAGQQGRVALCHASAHEIDVLKLSKLDTLLPLYGSREEAISAVRN